MYFYIQDKRTKEIEEKINNKIKKFVSIIYKDRILRSYIETFGLVGPTARGEGFFINTKIRSDFDFYVITKKINPLKELYLKKKFYEIFKNCHAGILVAAPTIFKRPDLMFFEFCSSGKVLYGKRPKISIKKISRFECFRNIIYRGCFFLNQFDVFKGKLKLKRKDKYEFLYNYSKIIFAIGEIFLLLKRKYKASNFERNKLIKKNIYAKKLKNFISEHEKMHKFRYLYEVPKDFDFNIYTEKAFRFILLIYKILSKKLFGCDDITTCKKFLKIKPNFLSKIATRFFFFLNNLIYFKKLKLVIFKEPFVILNLKFYKFVKDFLSRKKLSKKELEDILEYWKTAGWFYYYI